MFIVAVICGNRGEGQKEVKNSTILIRKWYNMTEYWALNLYLMDVYRRCN